MSGTPPDCVKRQRDFFLSLEECSALQCTAQISIYKGMHREHEEHSLEKIFSEKTLIGGKSGC